MHPTQILLATAGSWHLPHTARAYHAAGSLAEIWTSDRIKAPELAGKWRRCKSFHAAMTPFYRFAPQIVVEKAFYAALPVWKHWIRRQRIPADCDAVQGIMGYCTELFDLAESTGKRHLKIVDCANSHPVTYLGFWQRECDLWCPGERVPIPGFMFSRMNRELERADLIVVQSTFCKDSMILNGIPAEKVFVNPMGVDTGTFTPRSEVPAKPRFVMVATICLRKGHQYLFRAFEKVKRELPDAELICIGAYKSDFRMERPRWEGSFTHLPGVPHSELAKLLRDCTAFVFPSLEEGIGRAQIEALAAGLPVIGTHEAGTTTMVEDGVQGYIVRGRDPDQLAERMIRIAKEPEANARMGHAAFLKGGDGNSWQDYGNRLLAEISRRRAGFGSLAESPE